MVISDWREASPGQASPFAKIRAAVRQAQGSRRTPTNHQSRITNQLSLRPRPGKENLVRVVLLLFMIASMNQKQRFWLLVLVLATLVLSSCMNEEGIAPAQGEVTRPGANSAGY
jgi:hypothetical protein